MIGFERDTKKSINFHNYNSLYEEWKEIVLPEIKKTKVYEKNSVKRRKETKEDNGIALLVVLKYTFINNEKMDL